MRALIWNNLGMIAVARHDFRQAREMYAKASHIWLAKVGREGPMYSATLSNIAGLEGRLKHHKKSEALYRQVLQIQEARLGPDHLIVADTLANMAAELFYQKKYGEAATLYERAEVIQEKAIGKEHPDVARTWHNLAITEMSLKDFSKADQAYRSAIRALESSQGPDGLSLSAWLREYAQLLRRTDRFAEAEQADVRALGIEVRNAIRGEKLEKTKGGATAFSTSRGRTS
jgi:tetratricopeptide (TPR) repeat protein